MKIPIISKFQIFFLIFYCASQVESKNYFVDYNHEKLTHFYYNQNQLRCDMYGNRDEINRLLSQVSSEKIVQLHSMENVLNICSQVELNYLVIRRNYIPSSRSIIFPGTKWCGSGNVSQSYDDLGTFEDTDMCCRDHDHCPDTISAGATKYGLKNKQLGAVSHCDCDDEFYSCLKSHDKFISNKMGKLFFNVLGQPCFKFEYPIVKCLEWGGLQDSQCQKYELDYTQEKKWQFFDAKEY